LSKNIIIKYHFSMGNDMFQHCIENDFLPFKNDGFLIIDG